MVFERDRRCVFAAVRLAWRPRGPCVCASQTGPRWSGPAHAGPPERRAGEEVHRSGQEVISGESAGGLHEEQRWSQPTGDGEDQQHFICDHEERLRALSLTSHVILHTEHTVSVSGITAAVSTQTLFMQVFCVSLSCAHKETGQNYARKV